MTWKIYLAGAGVGLLLHTIGTPQAIAQTTTASTTAATTTAERSVASSSATTSTALVTEGEPTFATNSTYTARELTTSERRRVTNLAANLSNYYEAMIARLEQIADRLERRIARYDTTGYDLTLAAEQVQVAKTSLLIAATTMADIDSAIHNVVTNATPLNAWQDAKTIYQSVHTEITTAKTALTEAAYLVRTITSTPINSETRPLDIPDQF